MVPASVELKVYAGVVSLVRAVTAVTSASIGAVVSVVVVLSVNLFPYFPQLSFSLFSPQEIMKVKPKQEISTTYKIFFILTSLH